MTGDAEAIVETALAAAEPKQIDSNGRYVVALPDGGHFEIVEPQPDAYLDAPRRVIGTTVLYDADSLSAVWAKYADNGSELFADPKRFEVVGVFNADIAADKPGFRDHRAVLKCETSPEWDAWMMHSGKLLKQSDFADFLEDRVLDVAEPSGAEMLEIATTFQQTANVEFTSAFAPSSGQRQFSYVEKATARAGQKGTIEIPSEFKLGLRPFVGSDLIGVKARFRSRVREGVLLIGYTIERPDAVLREAFISVVEAVEAATERKALLGTSAVARI